MADSPDEISTQSPKPNYKAMYRNLHSHVALRLKWLKNNPFVSPGTMGNAHEKLQRKLGRYLTNRVIEMPYMDMVWCYVILGLLQSVFCQVDDKGGRIFLYFNSRGRLCAVQSFVTRHVTNMRLVWHDTNPCTPEWQPITVVIECHRSNLINVPWPPSSMPIVLEIYDHISERQMEYIKRDVRGINSVYLVSDPATVVPLWCRAVRNVEIDYARDYVSGNSGVSYSDTDDSDSYSDSSDEDEALDRPARVGCTVC